METLRYLGSIKTLLIIPFSIQLLEQLVKLSIEDKMEPLGRTAAHSEEEAQVTVQVEMKIILLIIKLILKKEINQGIIHLLSKLQHYQSSVRLFIINLIDLDNYVEFKSISRAGFKFSPDKLLPRCEIVKMRPKLLAEKHKE